MLEQRIAPDALTFNALMARAPRYGEAMDLLTQMRRENVAPDVTTFNTLMARAPDQELAVDLLRRMETADVSPTAETFKTLIGRSSDYATAVGWLAEMGRRGVRPNNEVFKALIENAAGEQAARRIAMKNATDNADELIRILTRSFNRARQSQITTELTEIIGGAAALE